MRILLQTSVLALAAGLSSCTDIGELGFKATTDKFSAGDFSGVGSIQLSTEGKYIIIWNHQTSAEDVSQTSYEIYMDRWDPSTPVPTSALASSLKASGSENLPGASLVDLAEEQTPAVKGALISSVKGVRSYSLTESLQKGTTYMFQVRVVGPNGDRDSNNRVLFYNPDSRFYFKGLDSENVVVAPDQSKITLTWIAATGAKATLKYIVYADSNFTDALATTTNTTFEYLNPIKGQSYTFSVRAFDGDIADDNKKFVVITVPDPSDKIPPVFGGIVSATTASDKKVVLKWAPSPSLDLDEYVVYFSHNLTTPIGSTSGTNYLVGGLTAGQSYSFTVRARDASGNEDSNRKIKSAQTLSVLVPDFAGLELVSPVGGLAGLTSLHLSWSQGSGTNIGYKIYQSQTSGTFDFNAPVADISSATTTSYTITGLTNSTKYYFVVRAYDSSYSPTRFELNTLEKSGTTLQNRPPTFSGISSAQPGAGSLAFSTAIVEWPAPASDGVNDGYVVQYELGSCIAGFSATPTEVLISGESLRTATVTSGLSAANTYRFRVRTRLAAGDIRDTNTTCAEIFTSPAAPNFAGISALTRSSGASGFTQAQATWAAATGSFTYYRVQWANNANFAAPTTITPDISTIGTTSRIITGLPANTTVFVRVSAVFDDGVNPVLSSGATQMLSVLTTPTAPTGEGISTVQIVAADSLKVNWTAPTNISSAVYNGYKLWKSCGANAAAGLITKLNGPADHTYPSNQLNVSFSGLTSNSECCYQVRAHYSDGTNSLASQSSVNYQCKTPTLSPPTFAGATTVVNGNTAAGFSTLTVTWDAVDISEASLFSYYEIDWATTPTGHDWLGTQQVATRTSTSASISGLTDNTTYYVRVRAVNSAGSPAVSSGADAVASATTTPKTPTGDNLATASSIASTKISLSYTPPDPSLNTGGLYNNVFLFIQAGTTSDVSAARTSIETGGVANAEVQGVISAGKFTVTSLPALVRVPSSEINAGTANTYEIWGLTANAQVCVQASAVYWVDGQTGRYLKSDSPTTRCTTPTAGAPAFDGVATLSAYGDQRDFTQIIANWIAPTGDCTGIDVSVSTSAAVPNFAGSYQDISCSSTSQVISSLNPHTTYYIQVRAKNVVSGTTYANGQGIELSKVTRPTAISGDGMSNVTFTIRAKSYDKGDLTYVLPTAGFWNKVYIWKGTGAGDSAARAAAETAAATKTDNTGPTTAPTVTINKTGSTPVIYTDEAVTDGLSTCYLMRGVYSDGTYYQASSNVTTRCGSTSYVTPNTGGGAASASLDGTWSDGTAKVKISFNTPPSGDIESYNIYVSVDSISSRFDLTTPWQTFDAGDATYDADTANNYIHVGANNLMFAGTPLYFIVRYVHVGGPDTDNNTSVVSVNVPTNQSNFVHVNNNKSRLGYSYFIGTYEASHVSGSTGSDTITTNEANLTTCSYQFHVNGDLFHSSCGTKTTTTKVAHKKDATTLATNWEQAYAACRNSSAGGVVQRLPTEEEWRRASKWPVDDYTGLLPASFNHPHTCPLWGSGNVEPTGQYPGCQSRYGAFDMNGNQNEWVDQRTIAYNITTSGEARFNYGPTVGRLIANGIDTQHSGGNVPLTRRLHNVSASPAMYLGMGSSHAVSWGDVKGDPETEYWVTASGRGFRCVAFPNKLFVPSMAALAQAQEPKYSDSDITGGAAPSAAQLATWTMPENFYVKDVKPESVTINMPPFVNTTGLNVWAVNQTGATIDDLSGNNMPLSVAAGVASAASIDGNATYKNLATNTNPIYATDAGFRSGNNGGAFTMGISFYKASAGVYTNKIMGSNLDTGSRGWAITYDPGATGKLCLQTSDGSSTYLECSPNIPTGSVGWYQVVWVRKSSTSNRLFLNGLPVLDTTGNLPIGEAVYNVYLGSAFNGNYPVGQIANAFYHAGVAYSNSEVYQRLYKPFTSTFFTSNNLTSTVSGSISISWSPWSKQSCSPTCTTSADSGFTYDLYRYVEPTRVDRRFRIPWAIGAASGNPYTTTMPMNPLETDSSGADICTSSTTVCKKIASVAGSACNSSTPAGCTFTDKSSLGNGFDPKKLYNYIMVVRDAQGNSQFPVVQAYRTFERTGMVKTSNITSFRHEPRFRRAGVFLVDEAFQYSAAAIQANAQAMVYVPMNDSGLDHDYFIDKYEAASYSGSFANTTPFESATWPLQADTSGVWVNNAASCNEKLDRLGYFDVAACGNGSVINATTTILQSKAGVVPIANGDQGAFWKACANTAVVDGSGYSYFKRLPSNSEWFKAADWGDLNLDGTIDVGMNRGITNASLDNFSTADTTTMRCHIDDSPNAKLLTDSTQTANCMTRFGALDMIGNYYEYRSDQKYNSNGLDNGVDGLTFGPTFFNNNGNNFNNTLSSQSLRFDLLRGYPVTVSAGGSTFADTIQRYNFNAGHTGVFGGGNLDGYFGRFAVQLGQHPSFERHDTSARCRR